MLRNYLLLRSAHWARIGERAKDPRAENASRGDMLLALLINQYLPRRYRWRDGIEFTIYMRYEGLSKRERERRLASKAAYLQETMPKPMPMTPDVQRQSDRVVRLWRKNFGYQP